MKWIFKSVKCSSGFMILIGHHWVGSTLDFLLCLTLVHYHWALKFFYWDVEFGGQYICSKLHHIVDTVMCLHLYNVCTIQTVDQDYHNWRSRPRYTSTGANRRKRKPRYEAGVGEFVRSGVSLQTQTILTSGGLTRKSKVPRLGGV